MSRTLPVFSLVFPLVLAAGTALAGEIRAVRLIDDAQGTRAVVEVDGSAAGYKLFTLDKPDRLVLDLPASKLAADFRAPGPNGVVASIRTGRPTADTLRLVFDLGRSVRTDSRLEREGEQSRLTVTLLAPGQVAAVAPTTTPSAKPASRPATRPSATAATADARPFTPPVSQAIALPEETTPVAIALEPAMPAPAPEPVPAKAAPVAAATGARPGRTVRDVVGNGQRKLVVAIDAGHGGKDPGALGPSGVREKNVTLATARELARQINADPGMRAVLIRDGDVFVPLKQRYMKARAAQADLFISIHADAAQNDAANGASVFVLSTRGASSQAARWLADQENAADLVGGVTLDEKDRNLAAVLLDLSQSATMRASDDIASEVLGALKNVGKAHKPAIERANFVVLRSPDVPSMLVETGFITNPGEEQKLNDPAYRSRLAAAISSGVRKYFAEQAPPGTWYAARRGDAGAGLAGGLVAGTPE
jgi:N-acetylmuramoyl-L-alanine amidase